jgi:hypothetical protein
VELRAKMRERERESSADLRWEKMKEEEGRGREGTRCVRSIGSPILKHARTTRSQEPRFTRLGMLRPDRPAASQADKHRALSRDSTTQKHALGEQNSDSRRRSPCYSVSCPQFLKFRFLKPDSVLFLIFFETEYYFWK